jgi:hypothetical protein
MKPTVTDYAEVFKEKGVGHLGTGRYPFPVIQYPDLCADTIVC